jgi:hypothetical protein
MGKEQQLAYLKTLADRGDLDKVSDINGQSLGDFINNKDLLNRYGQQGLGKAYDTATMNNDGMRQAQKEINHGFGKDPITIGDTKYNSAEEALKAESDKFVSGLTSKDVSKINTKMAFDGKNKEKEAAVMDSIARINPGLANTITRNMNGAQKKEFSENYTKILNEKIPGEEKVQTDNIDKDIETKEKNIEDIKNHLEGAKKMVDSQNRINELQKNLDTVTQELKEKMEERKRIIKEHPGPYTNAQKQFKKNMSNQAFEDFFDSETK